MRAARSAWIVGGVRTARVVGAHRDELLEEERVPLRRVHHLVASTFARRRVASAAEQAGRVGVGERLEPDDAAPSTGARPRRPPLEQVAAREADDQDRRPVRLRRDVLDEVEHRGLGPVDVVEGGDERAAAGERLEEPAHGPLRRPPRSRLPRCGPTRRRRATPPPRGWESPAPGAPRSRRRRDAAEVVHDLDQRPVGDALAVGQAAADDDASPRPRRSPTNSFRMPRLADPGRAERRVTSTHRSRSDARRNRVVQQSQLGAPADQRRRPSRAVNGPPGRRAPRPATPEAAAVLPFASTGRASAGRTHALDEPPRLRRRSRSRRAAPRTGGGRRC